MWLEYMLLHEWIGSRMVRNYKHDVLKKIINDSRRAIFFVIFASGSELLLYSF